MDRRQKKTRQAIFTAFKELLSKKSFSHITVGEIIEKADVGRATFYAHFETKEYLLKELSDELFCHIFDSLNGEKGHQHIFSCTPPKSVFLHLLMHIQNNDFGITDLLSSENDGLFWEYFKNGLKGIVFEDIPDVSPLPKEFVANHIVCSFAQTVKWWINDGFRYSPEQINEFFLRVINF